MSTTKLSASKLKILSDCSQKFYAQYVLKLPRTSNSGASRGTICHLIYECFLNKRHRKHYDLILAANNISGSPAIKRLVDKTAKKLNINDEENLDLINIMVLSGMKFDFYCEGSLELHSEWEFNIKSEGKYNYHINGFIDKRAIYADDIIVFDYKSSKKRFQDHELDGNLQALTYALAVWKTSGVIPSTKFLFLRFPKKIEQVAPQLTIQQLNGYEAYLDYITKYISVFTEKDAATDLAYYDVKRRWLCGRNQSKNSKVWGCDAKFPFDYFALISEDGQVIKTSMENDLQPKENQKVEKRFYAGCPAFQKKEGDNEDFF